jgi:hypothetical protein
MDVFNADVVDELGEEERKGRFARGSLRAFGCRLLMMISLFERGSRHLVRSCLNLKPDSESSALLLGMSKDFSAVAQAVAV